MNRSIKIFIGVILLTGVLTQKEICQHLGFGQTGHNTSAIAAKDNNPQEEEDLEDYDVDETLYEWDDVKTDWVAIEASEQSPLVQQVAASLYNIQADGKPTVIDWRLLMEIKYKLRYFEALEMEMYAPVFTDALKALDGEEVIIKGYVIPIDIENDIMALSANPYASCFFCGKASPASVMNLHLKKKKRYKTDAYKNFRGTLQLNYDDPNQFYYILQDAVPVK